MRLDSSFASSTESYIYLASIQLQNRMLLRRALHTSGRESNAREREPQRRVCLSACFHQFRAEWETQTRSENTYFLNSRLEADVNRGFVFSEMGFWATLKPAIGRRQSVKLHMRRRRQPTSARSNGQLAPYSGEEKRLPKLTAWEPTSMSKIVYQFHDRTWNLPFCSPGVH